MQIVGQWLGVVYGVYVRIARLLGGVGSSVVIAERFGVRHWKSPSRLFPNADSDVTGQSRVPGISYAWRRLRSQAKC